MLWQSTITKAIYKRKHLIGMLLTVWEGEPMTIMPGSMVLELKLRELPCWDNNHKVVGGGEEKREERRVSIGKISTRLPQMYLGSSWMFTLFLLHTVSGFSSSGATSTSLLVWSSGCCSHFPCLVLFLSACIMNSTTHSVIQHNTLTYPTLTFLLP